MHYQFVEVTCCVPQERSGDARRAFMNLCKGPLIYANVFGVNSIAVTGVVPKGEKGAIIRELKNIRATPIIMKPVETYIEDDASSDTQ